MARKLIHTVLNKMLDFLMPQKCVGCKTDGKIICEKCLDSMPCSRNIKHPALNIVSATSYQTPLIKKVIWLLKYRGIKILADPIGQFVYKRTVPYIKNVPINNTLILPIPISKKRFRERGFNQAALIAEFFGAASGIAISSKNLIKKFNTPSQVEVSNRRERLKNLKDSFEVRDPKEIFGKTILLIDDVSTTGATLTEAARVLKKSGAEKIICLVVAAD